jgi:aryl-alcohol dehydrogenase-like predicted oxidoreductase
MALATKQLGVNGPRVSALGLGCMGMGKSSAYGGNDPAEGIRTIHAAVAAGVTLLDTGDFYGMGQNELLVRRALEELGPGGREKVVLSVKFGAQRAPDGSWVGLDCRPGWILRCRSRRPWARSSRWSSRDMCVTSGCRR